MRHADFDLPRPYLFISPPLLNMGNHCLTLTVSEEGLAVEADTSPKVGL